jgi:predicted nucleic acid-binding protein
MNPKRVFIDTNILFYAHDVDAGLKHQRAAGVVLSAWEGKVDPCISVQVLQEFLVNLRRRGLDDNTAESTVADYLVWRTVDNTVQIFLDAVQIMKAHQLSFWDASIIAAALKTEACELWTEDLNSGQVYGKIKAVNPLL